MQLPERFLRVPRGDSGFQPITAGHQVTTGSATCAGPIEAGHSVGAHFYAVRLADGFPSSSTVTAALSEGPGCMTTFTSGREREQDRSPNEIVSARGYVARQHRGNQLRS